MEILYAIETVLGIGLLIFFHELGHFLAARWSGVRVDAFSLGFGPILLARQKGPTEYRLSLIPIGGYVKLAGELPGEDRTGAPDELCSKSAAQRAFIFSAGVLMNLLIALILFPLVFWIGVPFVEPVIGEVAPGGLGWKAGLKPGTKVLEIDGSPVYGFEHILSGVALGSRDGVRMLVETPDGQRQELWLRSNGSPSDPLDSFGVSPIADRNFAVVVDPTGPAARAGVQTGDRLLKINGQAIRQVGAGLLQQSISQGDPLQIEFQRNDQELHATILPEPAAKGYRQIGVRPPHRRVLAIRENVTLLPLPLQAGDVLLSVDGTLLHRSEDLEQSLKGGGEHQLRVLRGLERDAIDLLLPSGARERLLRDVAVGPDGETNELVVLPRSPAYRAGVRSGDRVVQIGNRPTGNFTQIAEAIRSSDDPEIVLTVKRGLGDHAELLQLVVSPTPSLSYGLGIPQSYYTYRTENIATAAVVGMRCSLKFIEDVYLTLKRMLTRELSAKHLGGILQIGGTAFKVSQMGFTKLLFFLALLSINLAVLNILPIPILDGGHLLFLLIEKIKGSPVSERAIGYSQVFGLLVLISLMVFATYNDIRNLFFP